MTTTAPLAEVLAAAAHAWPALPRGQSLDGAIALAVSGRPEMRPAVLDVSYTAVRHLAFAEHAIRSLASRPRRRRWRRCSPWRSDS